MSAATYSGPERRLLPREGPSLPSDAEPLERLMMRVEVIRRVVIGGYLDREQSPPKAPRGYGA